MRSERKQPRYQHRYLFGIFILLLVLLAGCSASVDDRNVEISRDGVKVNTGPSTGDAPVESAQPVPTSNSVTPTTAQDRVDPYERPVTKEDIEFIKPRVVGQTFAYYDMGAQRFYNINEASIVGYKKIVRAVDGKLIYKANIKNVLWIRLSPDNDYAPSTTAIMSGGAMGSSQMITVLAVPDADFISPIDSRSAREYMFR